MGQTNAADPDSIRRYLLGTPTADEQQGIELRLLTDPAFFDELSAREDELVDEYASGLLTPAERASFETVFLAAPERRQKLQFALALRRRLDQDAPLPSRERPAAAREKLPTARATLPTRRAELPAARTASTPSEVTKAAARANSEMPRPHPETPRLHPETARANPATTGGFFGRLSPTARRGFASALVVASATTLLLAVRSARQTPPAAPAAVQRVATQTRQHAEGAGATAAARTLAVTLKPGLLRGGGEETPRVAASDHEMIRFTLLLASAEHAAYQVSVRTFEGAEVGTVESLSASTEGNAPAVVFELPASKLAPGDYRVKLSGLRAGRDPENLPGYQFRVPRP